MPLRSNNILNAHAVQCGAGQCRAALQIVYGTLMPMVFRLPKKTGCVSILHARVGAGKEVLSQESRSIFHPVIQMSSAISLSLYTKGQLILKGLFGFFNSFKKRTKNFCPNRLGQKCKNIFVRFLVQMKTSKSPFKIN